MHYTDITGNGVVSLSYDTVTRTDEVTIYAPADIGTATIVVGWKDSEGTVSPYANGAILAGSSTRVRCGRGVDLVATVAVYSTAFKIGYAG